MAAFIAGLKDPTQASYQVQRSFEAIVNGGWFGSRHRARSIKSNWIACAAHRQHLCSDCGGTGCSRRNLLDWFVWAIDLARTRDCTPRARHARHTDRIRSGDLDWHSGSNQHVGNGRVDSFFRRRVALCQLGRIESGLIARLDWNLNEHFASKRRDVNVR